MAALFKSCSVVDCNGNAHQSARGRRGWCNAHYLRWQRHGDPRGGGPPIGPSYSECTVPGCSKRHFGRGWCVGHYKRWRRHGHPLLGNINHGEALRYFKETVLPYSGDDCLKWPYSCISGYGAICIKGRNSIVSRLVCEHVNGPPPTPEHEAAHLCGKGNEGCCTGRHLVWKTHAGNMADTLVHGTSTKGERNALAKLTDDNVREIRLMRGTAPHTKIAKQFGVSRSCIGSILQGKTWTHVR